MKPQLHLLVVISLMLMICSLSQLLTSSILPTQMTQQAAFEITSTAVAVLNATQRAYLSQTRAALATMTPTPAPCFFNWARQDLPEVTALAQAVLVDFPQLEVRAEAYGENCVDSTTHQARYFGAITTDFYVVVQVNSLSDYSALAATAVDLYHRLAALPSEELPAPPGYLDITFASGGETKGLRAMFSQYRQAVQDGLIGEALLQVLGGLR